MPFFTNGGGASEISAKNISVNVDLLNDPTKLAAGQTSAVDDNRNVLKMLEIRNTSIAFTIDYIGPPAKTTVIGEGKPDDILKTIIASLGVDTQQAKRMHENQSMLTEEIDIYRMSVSGVHLDEEMSNMIKYQHAYNASARMITTVDEMIDVIINRMGRVGL
ncbi:flagellar hook-associated protein FlgK [Acetoanaerobium pronyense]|uniref:Flagellar hook-associated protein FlgK n=2 Tax=Acetoanaerobium pronyense TaxID=1482736 RepID=A0ABS4KJ57_9FIRM|nr:flagellar hook-associated protein FlgK [Acetoanaerobium pronyense]